ncbi:hypothetical protein BU16DRAFT_579322 [Lophium mytilinum]|uniref:Uncharacterized protein n=1 Tax=Lophium mytilinum TaxID=390894 RepID=A0A6A6R544_9PEZI|nr:hypothetical protein BU16DRAFT_579322 [Lophium mytilinum]
MAEPTASPSLPSTTPHEPQTPAPNPGSTGIPIAMIGAYEKIGAELAKRLAPEFDTVHHSLIEDAFTEIPLLLTGDLSAPHRTGIGSNAQRAVEQRRFPVLVVLGKEAPPEIEEQVLEAVKELEAKGSATEAGGKEAVSARGPVKFLRAGVYDKNIIGKGGPPDVGRLVEILRGKLREALGAGEGVEGGDVGKEV